MRRQLAFALNPGLKREMTLFNERNVGQSVVIRELKQSTTASTKQMVYG